MKRRMKVEIVYECEVVADSDAEAIELARQKYRDAILKHFTCRVSVS